MRDLSGMDLNFLFASASGYTGPGDIVSGALGWWGLRAYNNAAIGTKCVRLIRASDSTQQDFNTVAGGGVDLTSISSFLAATTGKVVTLYDQSGNTLDLTQATDANRPLWTGSVVGSLPGVNFDTTAKTLASAGNTPATAQAYTMNFVSKQTGNTGSNASILAIAGGGQIDYTSSGTKVGIYNGGSFVTSTSFTASIFHAAQGIFNGASSIIYVDGTSDAVNIGNTNTTAANAMQMGLNGLVAYVCEAGMWPSGFSGANNSSMNSNQHTYWGF